MRALGNCLGAALCLWVFPTARAADVLPPDTAVVPSENAARETLQQSSRERPLRLGGLDIFPHAGATVMYDDNVLIQPNHETNDVEWTIAPGLMIAAGDVSATLKRPVTIDELRGLLFRLPAGDVGRPQRFLAVDFTPAINLFTDHDEFNTVDYPARLSAGYTLSRLTLGLDQDFYRLTVKDNETGTRVATRTYNTRLRGQYELTDRTSVEVGGQYLRYEYEDPQFEGYQEFRNEDWFNWQIGGKLTPGLGAAFGFVEPDVSPDQTYQQLLGRTLYRLTSKVNLVASVGVEWRQYESGAADTFDPVFGVSAFYEPREGMTLTVEGYRRQEPSSFGGVNYLTYGFSAGVRQRVLRRFYAGFSGGYDNTEYRAIEAGVATDRTDSYFLLQVNLDYEFNPHWKAGVFYTHRQDDSNIGRFSYANNLVGFQVLWYY